MLLNFDPLTSTNNVMSFIESDAFLNSHLLDVQELDDLLIVLTDGEIPTTVVELLLRRVWSGSIEIYGPSDMIIGA